MKTVKKILNGFIRVVEVLEILLIAGIVGVMLYELLLRNLFNRSFRASTELCGFLFMWMAFLGIDVLYAQDRLITLDMIYTRVPPAVQKVFWIAGRVAAAGLGVIMVLSYRGLYPVISTSRFSTMQFITKAWHFLPMAITGCFFVVKSVVDIIDLATGSRTIGKEAQ